MPEEKTLDFIVGKDKLGEEIKYISKYFEWHIEEALESMKFFSGALRLGGPKFIEKRADRIEIARESIKPYNGMICRYARSLTGRIESLDEINDHKKIIEKIMFAKGLNMTSLNKGDYSILFRYVSNREIAEKAIRKSYGNFKALARLPQDRELNKESIPGGYILDFGSEKDKLHLNYELVFQFDLLVEYLKMLKQI